MSHNFRTDKPGTPTRTQLRKMARSIPNQASLGLLIAVLSEDEARAFVARLRPYLSFLITKPEGTIEP